MDEVSEAKLSWEGGVEVPSQKKEEGERVELAIDGMHCASCVRTIETALESVPGVSDALVNLGTGRARIAGRDLDATRLAAAVEATGYQAGPPRTPPLTRTRSARRGSCPTS
jgi:copper chaperone CopZ